jgi:hypothetical protein
MALAMHDWRRWLRTCNVADLKDDFKIRKIEREQSLIIDHAVISQRESMSIFRIKLAGLAAALSGVPSVFASGKMKDAGEPDSEPETFCNPIVEKPGADENMPYFDNDPPMGIHISTKAPIQRGGEGARQVVVRLSTSSLPRCQAGYQGEDGL